MGYNFLPCDSNQAYLLPPSLTDWLPEDHLAWFVKSNMVSLDGTKVKANASLSANRTPMKSSKSNSSRDRNRTRATLGEGLGHLGTSMSKPLSRRSRDFFTGIPNIYSASPDSGAPVDYVRAGSSHHNEVAMPQSPRTESSRMIPPIVTHASCLPNIP